MPSIVRNCASSMDFVQVYSGSSKTSGHAPATSASLIGRLGSSTFRLSAVAVSMSLAGSCFSSESAPRPFHHGIRRQGGTIFTAALPSDEQQVQAEVRTPPHPSSREGHHFTAR